MKLKCFLQFIILCSITFFPLSVCAADFSSDEARAWMDQKGKEVLKIMTSFQREDKFKQLDTLLFNDVDLDYAGQFVVGKYWKKMTPEQQKKYIPLFKRYTSALYKEYPLTLDKGAVTYVIDKVIADNDSQYVYCTIYIASIEKNVDETSKDGVKVVFRLVLNNGKIQVRDLQIAESSFLRAYRERFYKMIHEDDDDDMEWFLDDLQELTIDMEKEITQKNAAPKE